MCRILLSINPEHIENIFNGTKTFEFRKIICKKEVSHIVMYSTSPVKKVVGEAKVVNVLIGTPNDIWEKTFRYSGVDKKFFDFYFKDKELAVAYELDNVIKYDHAKQLSDFGVSAAPQSFVYL